MTSQRSSSADEPTAPEAQGPAPRLRIVHVDDVPWNEVLAQRHGERRVSVHEKFLEWVPERMVVLGRYDAGMIVERHGHASDHLVYVLEGDLLVDDRPCTSGTLIVLEKGAVFGPLVAGEEGCLLFETWAGDPSPVPADREGYRRLLGERAIERLSPPKFTPPDWAEPGRYGTGEGYG